MNAGQIKVIPLLIVVAMMAFSVRLVDFSMGVSNLSGAAFAKKTEKPKEKEEAPKEKQGEKGDASNAKDEPAKEMAKEQEPAGSKWRDAKDEGIGAANIRADILDDFAKRRKTLEAKEQGLTAREALLRATEQELDQKYKELLSLRTQIEELLGTQSEEEQKRITSIVKIYEGMKPKDAARIFDTLDLDVLLAVMSRMSERKLSPVLAAMNPERARTITIMLAEEKRLPSLL